mmetsp:Transcript_9446/g.14873  ORF Transcript_9446/g.14873 Transcript_9446/m.14873 type:complete len:213 (-) Transcript_9446:709-1347(-)
MYTRRSLEGKAQLPPRGRRHAELEPPVARRRVGRQVLVLLLVLRRKELLQHRHGLLVHLLVLVLLQGLDLLDAVRLVHQGDPLHGLVVGVGLAQQRLQRVQGHQDDLRVRDAQQVANRLQAALVHQHPRVLPGAARGHVGDHPTGLLAHVPLPLRQLPNGVPNDVGRGQQGGDLGRRARRDVGEHPAGLLADGLLRVAQQRWGNSQDASINH